MLAPLVPFGTIVEKPNNISTNSIKSTLFMFVKDRRKKMK